MGGRAPEKLPNSQPRFHERSPRRAPRLCSLPSKCLQSWGPRACDLGTDPGRRSQPERGGPRPLQPAGTTATHRAHLGGTPTPGFAGPGAPGPQLGGRGPRFPPQAEEGRALREGGPRGRGGCGERPDPHLRASRQLHASTRAPASSAHAAREPASPLASARRTPAAAQRPKLRPPGEGRTRRRDRGSARRRPVGAAAQGREASAPDPHFATGELRFAGGARGGCRWARPGAATSRGVPGSPLQQREGVEPSGRISRGRNERGQSRGSLQLARWARLCARDVCRVFIAGVCCGRWVSPGLLQNLSGFVVSKGRFVPPSKKH